MAKTKSIEAIRKNVDKVLTDRKREVDALESKISEMKAQESTAAADMEKATADSDATAYSAAKRSRMDSADAAEMYTAKLTHLQESPLVPEEDFKAMCSGVIDALTGAKQEAETKLADLTSQMVKIGEQYSAEIDEAQAVLTILHDDIFDWRSARLPNRKTIPTRFYETLQWAKGPSESYGFIQYTKTSQVADRSQRMADALTTAANRSGRHSAADPLQDSAEGSEDQEVDDDAVDQ